MIKQGSKLSIERISIQDLRVFEAQKRYPDRVTHYLSVLAEDESGTSDLGVIYVKPRDRGYEILDGHHRYVALILAGRKDALCLVIDEEDVLIQEKGPYRHTHQVVDLRDDVVVFRGNLPEVNDWIKSMDKTAPSHTYVAEKVDHVYRKDAYGRVFNSARLRDREG